MAGSLFFWRDGAFNSPNGWKGRRCLGAHSGSRFHKMTTVVKSSGDRDEESRATRWFRRPREAAEFLHGGAMEEAAHETEGRWLRRSGGRAADRNVPLAC